MILVLKYRNKPFLSSVTKNVPLAFIGRHIDVLVMSDSQKWILQIVVQNILIKFRQKS